MRYDVSIRQDNHLFSRSLPVSYICPNFFISTYPNSRLSQTSGNSLAALHNTYLGAIPHSISDFTAFDHRQKKELINFYHSRNQIAKSHTDYIEIQECPSRFYS